MRKRPYTLRRRAEQRDQTRRRIVEATVSLHQSLGVKNTTVSAIAENAGVERLTVYRHFPDQPSLLAACTSHWIERHQPPDPSTWIEVTDPVRRTARALRAIYAYYRTTEKMWTSSYRDRDTVPALRATMREFEKYLESVAAMLAESWSPRPGRRLRGAVGHALRFSTWQSLHLQKIDERSMAAMMGDWIAISARAARR